jgi:phosphate transport system substrate-binding protein
MKTAILTFGSALALIVTSTTAHAERLVIKGSDTLGAKLVPQLAEQFKAQHPDATFDIATTGSSKARGGH